MNAQVEAALIAGVVSLISLGGTVVVAVIGFRTTRSVTGSTLAEQRLRTMNERFATAAEKLGNDKPPAVRLAGVYAMAGLADDWEENRQTCVDVLCAYLRLPYDPDPGDKAPAKEKLDFAASREVRHTVIGVITAHLKDDAAVSWRGLNFNFIRVVFDGGNFTDAKFSGDTVDFGWAEFSGQWVDFSRVEFSAHKVNFGGTEFSGSTVDFIDTKFSDGVVDFSGAKFLGSAVRFKGAEFRNGTVNFSDAEFSGSTVDFGGAEFSGSTVNFGGAKFSDGVVDFSTAADWSRPPTFGWDGVPPPGVKLPAAVGQEPQ
jgi:hypothetical protein